MIFLACCKKESVEGGREGGSNEWSMMLWGLDLIIIITK